MDRTAMQSGVIITVMLAPMVPSHWKVLAFEPAVKDSGAVEKGGSDNLGDIVLRGLRTSAAKGPIEPVELVIASYNVQARPFLDDAKEKLPKISPLLNRFDIVLIQECFVRPDLLWGQSEFPNKVYFGRRASNRIANSGLAILTRLPMGEVETEHYWDVGEAQNRMASKGILLVRVLAGGAPIDIYNTHMEAGASASAQVARRGQARQVIEFVERHSPPEHSVILMGDFNMGPRRADKPWREYSHYSSEEDMRGRTEAFETMRGGLKLSDAADLVRGPTDDGIERLLFRNGTRSRIEPISCAFDTEHFRRANGSRLSDGSPLVVHLRVTPVPAR